MRAYVNNCNSYNSITRKLGGLLAQKFQADISVKTPMRRNF